MPHPYATLDDWIAREAIPFSLDSPAAFNAAVDAMIAALGDSVDLLGFSEALHGGEELLVLRNRLFERLVTAHGYTAIAIESSFPRGRLVDEYVAGQGPASYEDVQETGYSHGFGRLDANRELVEWMRAYNTDPSHRVKLRFYGFDAPTEFGSSDSPRRLLSFVLDYLAAIDSTAGTAYREQIEPLIGADADWEDPATVFDPTKSIGRSPAAAALRLKTEDLIAELHARRPELIAKGGKDRYQEAVQYATAARGLLNYHAGLAQASGDRVSRLLAMRDAMMADNLAYMVSRECGRGGRVLAFAHNEHLRRGKAEWQFGADLYAWWPAGAHLAGILGPRYAVIGSAVGISDANGVGRPEAGTLEAHLIAAPGPGRFIPTHRGEGLPAGAIPTRSGSKKNPGYFPLTPQSLAEFDWLAVLDSTGYTRGGPPLPE
ncbi:erythromycin esterase family protein [Methanoculleus sp.]|uniref:erythromycin esterase family protein n=1 Tax=Methanoculleus sp. TaxID=90427 RepID=UPI002600CB0D|nr:erythromycin esterase family protein [Methanoculleus sp.]